MDWMWPVMALETAVFVAFTAKKDFPVAAARAGQIRR